MTDDEQTGARAEAIRRQSEERRAQIERIRAEAEQAETLALQSVLGAMGDRILAMARARELAWAPYPCRGQEQCIAACSEAFEATCDRRLGVIDDLERTAECPKRRIRLRIARDTRRLEMQAARRRAEARQRALERGVSERILRCAFDRPPDETEAIRALREAFQSPEPVFVVLISQAGGGKSTAAGLWALEHDGRVITAPELARCSAYDDSIPALGAEPHLVLDDLGTEPTDTKGAFLGRLQETVELRYKACRPTVITANFPSFKAFREAYPSERMLDRFKQTARVRLIGGPSLRQGLDRRP